MNKDIVYIRKFLRRIAKQRGLMCSMNVSKKFPSELDLLMVEQAASSNDPVRWIWNHHKIVYTVCPQQNHKELNKILQYIENLIKTYYENDINSTRRN
jgi:hypothetical protein